jgi:hypothetical protein
MQEISRSFTNTEYQNLDSLRGRKQPLSLNKADHFV